MGNVELHKKVLDYVNRAADEHAIFFAEDSDEDMIKKANKLLEEKVDLLKGFDVVVGTKGALCDFGINYFVRLSVIAMRLYCSRLGLVSFEDKAKELHDIYKRKNNDYGNSFEDSLNKFGVIAAVVRLQDKVSRYESLTKKGNKQLVEDEKVEDTLLDLINYCIMTVMYYEGLYSNVDIQVGVVQGLVCEGVNYSVANLPGPVVDMWGVKERSFHNCVISIWGHRVDVPMYKGVEGTTVGYFSK